MERAFDIYRMGATTARAFEYVLVVRFMEPSQTEPTDNPSGAVCDTLEQMFE